jgi:hypothetical protein
MRSVAKVANSLNSHSVQVATEGAGHTPSIAPEGVRIRLERERGELLFLEDAGDPGPARVRPS